MVEHSYAWLDLQESTISFLGFCGSMLSMEGRSYMEEAPLLAFWPGLCLAIGVSTPSNNVRRRPERPPGPPPAPRRPLLRWQQAVRQGCVGVAGRRSEYWDTAQVRTTMSPRDFTGPEMSPTGLEPLRRDDTEITHADQFQKHSRSPIGIPRAGERVVRCQWSRQDGNLGLCGDHAVSSCWANTLDQRNGAFLLRV